MELRVGGGSALDPIDAALAHAHAVLPDQGPIGVFIHHNTLHAYQHLPFHAAVQRGSAELHAEPYLSSASYRAALQRGRIEVEDLETELGAELGAAGDERVWCGATRRELWRRWMLEGEDEGNSLPATFARAEGPQLAAASELPELRAACLARIERGPTRLPREGERLARHRDALLALGAMDLDALVHPELVRLAAVFLDQGQARTAMPGREQGFFSAVAALHRAGMKPALEVQPAAQDLITAAARDDGARLLIAEVLRDLQVPAEEQTAYLVATAFALPGWAGMFSRLERHPSENRSASVVRLIDFLAVRLAYERRALQHLEQACGWTTSWPELATRASAAAARDPRREGAVLLAAARAARLDASAVAALEDAALLRLWEERARCTPLARRRLWQEAYERRYRRSILDALAARRREPASEKGQLSAQLIFCIDEREESIRRALEELDPRCETFGAAGFFGLAIDYLGLDDHEPAPHAPVVVTPTHEVHEAPLYTERERDSARRRWRGSWHGFERVLAAESRGLLGGTGAALVFGPIAGFLALTRIAAPRRSLELQRKLARWFAPTPATRLSALRTDTSGQLSLRGKPIGFTVDEASERVASMLTGLGLVRDFAPIVVVLGHGSTSLNNPHESAHDCGACGGRRGGANARLFAALANRSDVRDGLRRRGLEIPAQTWFVGALHDTASDAVTYFDLGDVPAHAEAAFESVRRLLEAARRESALERCRRFEDAPLGISSEQALRHVEARSAALSQPRPEYGHCTNAIAVVGRRDRTRGLHLDRRAFLVSYDPSIDPEHAILERILAAVGPVGAGISLEYYFSAVDNAHFGCGTKLPHNVTGLLGVMNGHQGDLQTGLPLQMVELHEPMRLLLIVEATPEALLGIAARQPEVRELVVNRWVQLVSLHPTTGALQVLEKEPGLEGKASAFVPYEPSPLALPRVARSREWHGRTREHLPPALVLDAMSRTAS
ncbi:MAG: DUF2309 domain-containing protein [Planctomycetes bacterium]|nr:DUF2309 domain-containing protein [Planctomycetota bacterium]